ncbi:restriction endonuclease-related protein [Pseudonocardia hydrocarbonoxydans]|uniref:pPIWI_RE_Y domain-containing protein n=1 Tax=Pseudonocardia hydrocarbonoxydans TaxID=76726 RepID=UPI0031E46A45
MTATSSSPPWLLDGQILVAQLASGIAEFAEQVDSGAPFRLPYPVNLQAAFDQLTLLAWHQGVAPPGSVVELLQLAEVPFGEWAIALPDAYVDPEESLLVHGRLGTICEELGSLRGDVAGEMRENFLIRVVIDKCRAADAPDSYVAFRQLLIERPAITALDLDTALTRPELAPLSDELRSAYVPAPPEAISDGVVRTCAGCGGLRLPLEDDRTWACEDPSCPDPGIPGPDHPAVEGVLWLRHELRTFITAPGRAELRIAERIRALRVPVVLWPGIDSHDLCVFDERPWVADVKAWRHPARLAAHLRRKLFTAPPDAERAYVVIAAEQVKAYPGYVGRLRRECPAVRPGQRIVAVGEAEFLRAVGRRAGEAR